MKIQKNELLACPHTWSQSHWRASFRTAHGCRKGDNIPFNKKQTQPTQEKTMQSYQAINPRMPRRLDTYTDRECTQANRQLIANPSVAKVSRETHASRRSHMCCSYTTLLVGEGKPHSRKRREQPAPGRKTQPRTLPHTIPPHGGQELGQ